uniref:Wall-associated receptor kinase galacturonan-binding domain-containing protein n=1 Tax=Hordeum vulgare subsp. vulgare TaxID=112509 RepID=A0A8I6X3Q4_HORVV
MHGRFLILVWAWCLPLMVAVTGTTAEDQQGEGCSAKRCGNITISDPFWLPDEETGRSCGLPGASDFQLRCLNSSYPVLRSSVPYSPGFKIINISVGERSLRVVDLGKLQLFHTSKSCLPFWNTSVKLGRPFRIDPVSHNLILYNCTEEAAARRGTELVKTVMRCANATNTFVRTEVPYDPTGNYASYALEGCDAIVVPVLAGSPSGKTNADNYERLIDDGFLLTWDLDPLPPLF